MARFLTLDLALVHLAHFLEFWFPRMQRCDIVLIALAKTISSRLEMCGVRCSIYEHAARFLMEDY